MRILQLIDSLEAGGAERMAVSYANGLQQKIAFSALCATRSEGHLKELLLPEVGYVFLNKKSLFDFKALLKLRYYVKRNKIDFVHAHSSSFFIAVLLKLVCPTVRIVWHDHFGARAQQSKNRQFPLKLASLFFYQVLTVNPENEKWLNDVLLTKAICFIPNFVPAKNAAAGGTRLKGVDGKRIVFLANLKNPKNHLLFLEAFFESIGRLKGWSVHLVGKDYQDGYSSVLKSYIESNSLENDVFLYGSCLDTFSILEQASIGVLCSTYEGFPVTLLEYGLAKLAVVSTNVGFCPQIIQDNAGGLLFSPDDKKELLFKLDELLENKNAIISTFALHLNATVLHHYSEQAVLARYLELLDS